MSSHHQSKEWFRAARIARPIIKALVVAGEAYCTKCGWPVYSDQAWQIDHIIAVSNGGTDSLDNLGPAHKKCNLRDGGKLGAAITNNRHKATQPKVIYPY